MKISQNSLPNCFLHDLSMSTTIKYFLHEWTEFVQGLFGKENITFTHIGLIINLANSATCFLSVGEDCKIIYVVLLRHIRHYLLPVLLRSPLESWIVWLREIIQIAGIGMQTTYIWISFYWLAKQFQRSLSQDEFETIRDQRRPLPRTSIWILGTRWCQYNAICPIYSEKGVGTSHSQYIGNIRCGTGSTLSEILKI